MKFYLLFICLITFSTVFSQQDDPHELWENNSLPDSTRIDALYSIIWQEHLFSSPDSALFFAKIYLDIALKNNYKKRLFMGYNTLGTAYYFLGDLETALENYQKMERYISDYPNPSGPAVYMGNLANIYFYQEEYEKSLEYYFKVGKVFKEIDNKGNLGTTYNNIANIYVILNDYTKAQDYYQESLNLRQEVKDSIGMANTYGDLAEMYTKNGAYSKALKNYRLALSTSKSNNCVDCINNVYRGLGNFYLQRNLLDSSLFYAKAAYELSLQSNLFLNHAENIELMYTVYKKRKDFEEALEKHEEFMVVRDSLKNNENKNQLMLQDMKYSYKLKATADSLKAVEIAKVKDLELIAEQDKNKRRTQQILILIFGFGLALVFAVVAIQKYRLSQKQKVLIEHQKDEVDRAFHALDAKNNEILDSINYAKRIQAAILPSDTEIQKSLNDSFVFYQPKDIVAGDFYWLEKLDQTNLIAVADCTGHGVPGAMVSVICNNGLNRAVREHQNNLPKDILDKTREIVIKELSKSGEEVKDGMDIALCAITANKLTFSGANNSLWIVRNGELFEFKGDKQPIGRFSEAQPFTQHEFELEKNDVLYLFSDGYADQFGGDRGKKFKSANLKKLFLRIHRLPMAEQKEHLSAVFEQWKGNLEQLDDVCVIGVRV